MCIYLPAQGVRVLVFALVELRDESGRHLKGLQRQMLREPGVRNLHYVAGTADLVVEYRASSMEEYAAFAERCFNGDANVRRYSTLTVLRTLKCPGSRKDVARRLARLQRCG